MNLNETETKRIYEKVSEEYNKSPLSVNVGWYFIPNEFNLLELKQIIKYLPAQDGVFLDIGTGMGIAPRFVIKLGVRTISIDSRQTGGSALENVKRVGVEGYYCDVEREQIPLQDKSVNCVLFADVIEHLIHSPKHIINEIYRILKPGGVCVATTPNATRLTVRLKVLMGYSNWANIWEYYDVPFNYGHHHEYTIDEFKEVYHRNAFVITDFILYEGNLRYTKISNLSDIKTKTRKTVKINFKNEHHLFSFGKRILLFTTNIFPRLRSNMLLVARKEK